MLSDNAYAPYARRSARRRRRPGAARWPPSWPATASSCWWWRRCRPARTRSTPIAAAAGVPTLALDATLVQAAARPGVEGRIAAIWADGTLRAAAVAEGAPVPARRRRGGTAAVAGPGAGDRGRAARPTRRSLPDVPPDCIVALLCPYAAMSRRAVRRAGRLRDDDGRSRPPAADADGRARPTAAARAADAAQLASGARAGRRCRRGRRRARARRSARPMAATGAVDVGRRVITSGGLILSTLSHGPVGRDQDAAVALDALLDRGGLGGRRLAGRAVAHQLDAEEEPAAAHVADQRVRSASSARRPAEQPAAEHARACACSRSSRDHVEHREADRGRDRVAAEGVEVLHAVGERARDLAAS